MNINEIFRQLAEYKRMQEETSAIIDGLQDEIKSYMKQGGLDTLAGNEHKATYKEVVSNRIDTATLKKEKPEIYAAYTKRTSAMRFTFA